MSETAGFSVDEVKNAARELVRVGKDVREKLHELTVRALTQRQLAEQQLAAGIRRAGREALKARLKQRTRVLPLHQVNWYQVAGIAATIVVVVTLGIHYQWFFGSRVEEPVITEQEQIKAAEPADKAKRDEKDILSPAKDEDTERRPTMIPQAEIGEATATKKAQPAWIGTSPPPNWPPAAPWPTWRAVSVS